MQNQAIYSGFENPSRDAQASFKATMDAMAHPGKINKSPVPLDAPSPLNTTTAMLIATLCDFDSTVWLDEQLANNDAVRNFIAFHTSAPIVENRKDAQFAIISDVHHLGQLKDFSLGTDEYPDRSTTLIVQVGALSNQSGAVLTGPGIEFDAKLEVAGLPDAFWPQAQANNRLFPRGVDLIFAAPDHLACLPRSTKINNNEKVG